MRALLYHDVAPREEWDATGFDGGDAAVYKFERPDPFEQCALFAILSLQLLNASEKLVVLAM